MDEDGFTILEEVPAVIRLNVGGTKFTTGRSTLMKDTNSKLYRMFVGEQLIQKDDEGCFFIDRDPQHFQRILNFLRDGRCVLPESKAALAEMMQEAQFYELTALIDYITWPSATRDSNPGSFGAHLRAMVLEHKMNTFHLGDTIMTIFDFISKHLVARMPVKEEDFTLDLYIHWLSSTANRDAPDALSFRCKDNDAKHDVGVLLTRQGDPRAFVCWDRLWNIYADLDLLNTFYLLARKQGVLLHLCDSKKAFFTGDHVDEAWGHAKCKRLTLRVTVPATTAQGATANGTMVHGPPVANGH